MTKMFNPPHPGSILSEELEYLGVSAREFARNLGVSASSITRILNESTPITPEMAVRIAAAIPGPEPETWVSMQSDYDTWQAEQRIDVSHIRRYTVTETPETLPTR